VIKREDIPKIRTALHKELFPIERFSLYDLMMAAGEFARGKDEYVCQKSWGLLDEPYMIKSEKSLSASDVLEAVSRLEYGRFLPERIFVGDELVGTADLLIAAYDALDGEETVTVTPKPQLPSLDILPEVKKCSLKGTWLHSEEFEDKYLSNRLRLQSYTMHF
jgi:hypothetical protein